MVPQVCSYVRGILHVEWGFPCSRNPLPSPKDPYLWSPANLTVMPHCRESEGTSWKQGHQTLQVAVWSCRRHPVFHHLPASTPRESQCLQFSDVSAWRRQELSLGLMALGDVNTAKIPLINWVPPLDQWLALGELSTVLLVWLPSSRCYRWRNKMRRRGKKDKIISLKGAKEHLLYFVFRFRAALGAHTTIHFYAVSRSSVQPPDFPLCLRTKIPGASDPEPRPAFPGPPSSASSAIPGPHKHLRSHSFMCSVSHKGRRLLPDAGEQP